MLLALVVLGVIAWISAYLTAPRPGTRMDAGSTGPDGAHALATLLGDGGVDVVVAKSIADVENAARPDTLILVAESQYLSDETLQRLAKAPGDLLLVEPTARTREALLPGIRISGASGFDSEPNCTLREATRAGSVRFGPSGTFDVKDSRVITRCYDGVLIRFRDNGRTITAVGSSEFMTNGALARAGNAALAMNLAGDRPRLIWYAPDHIEGQTSSATSIFDLIPDNVNWIVWQLWVVVLLVALWKGRRPGPLVAEDLPVVVRASETVEGRGRLYRSRRARDRAAAALRTATLQRLLPRLGLGIGAQPQAVVITVAQRTGTDAGFVSHQLFGPPPGTDTDLLHLARALDEIERQVTNS
ncbi:putative membrane protein [Mycobacterium montefiorense]|nr:putative membrane protein [Mycobacterium montefiorense]